MNPPPAVCPACRTPLNLSYPVCPACGEPLTPQALRERAEAAALRGLGLPSCAKASEGQP